MKIRQLRHLRRHVEVSQSAPDHGKEKTTTIKTETHEVLVVARRSNQLIRMWCEECGIEVDMLNPEEAAAIAQVSTRTIYRWIEAGQIHHVETQECLLVCPKQLLR
jgi:hypothetical protein